MKRYALFALLIGSLTLAVAGCGDDEEDGGGDGGGEVVSAPEPTEALEEHVERVNQAIAEGDCEALVSEALSFTRIGPDGLPVAPGDPADPAECSGKAPAAGLLTAIKGTEFTESEEGGPAAFSEGQAGKPIEGYDRWTMLSLVDNDGTWRQLLFFPADPQLEEDPPEGADYAKKLDTALNAVRSGDCKGAGDAFDPNSRLAEGKGPVAACENLAGGEIFAPAFKATEAEDAQPEELVVTRDYAVYGIPTEEAYFAAVMVTPPGPPNQPPQTSFSLTELVPLTEVELPPPPKTEADAGPGAEATETQAPTETD